MPQGPFYLTYFASFDVYCSLLSFLDLCFVKRSSNLQLFSFCIAALKAGESKPYMSQAIYARSQLILPNLPS